MWGRKRIADSSDIWDASRSILMTGIASDGKTRYISQEKSNYGPLQDTVLFTLENSVPIFKGYTKKKDRDFVLSESKERAIRPATDTAKEFEMCIRDSHNTIWFKRYCENGEIIV